MAINVQSLPRFGALRALGSYLDSYYTDLFALGQQADFQRLIAGSESSGTMRRVEASVAQLLEGRDAAAGLGFLLESSGGRELGRRLYWWNRLPAGSESGPRISLSRPALPLAELQRHRWYRRSISTGVPTLTGPYIDAFGTGKFVVTFSLPLARDAIPVGVLGLTLELSFLEGLLLRRMRRVHRESLLVASDARILCSAAGEFSAGERLLRIPERWSIQRVPSRWLELGLVAPQE